MASTSASAFTARVDKEEEKFLQTYMPKYELCQVEKKYVTFWKLVFAAYCQAFPLFDKIWPGQSRTRNDLSVEETDIYVAALNAKQNSIREWFRWKANPRSRNTSNSVSKKDIQKIYQPGRRRSHKEYEVFAKLYPDIFNPVFEEACRIQGIVGRQRLSVYHKVASRLWREATQQVRSEVQKKVEEEQGERESELEKIEHGEDTPESYQHFQAALPGILTAAIDPAVRRAGMIAVCTVIGPVPEAGGQIMATTLQFGDSPNTPLFSQAWLEHDKSFVEALAQFAVKHEFPEELCSKRSLAPSTGDQAGVEPAGSASVPSQPPPAVPTSTGATKKGQSSAPSASKLKQPLGVAPSRSKEGSATTSKASTPVPQQAGPYSAPSAPTPSPVPSAPLAGDSTSPNPMLLPSAPGGNPPNEASVLLPPGGMLPHQPSPDQLTPGGPVNTGISPFPNLSTLSEAELSQVLYHDFELQEEDFEGLDEQVGGQVQPTWENLMAGFDPSKITANNQSDPDVWANLDILQRMSSADTNINIHPDIPLAPSTQKPNPYPTSGTLEPPPLPSPFPSSNEIPSASHQAPNSAAPSVVSALDQTHAGSSPDLQGGSSTNSFLQSLFTTPSSAPPRSWFGAEPLTSIFGPERPPIARNPFAPPPSTESTSSTSTALALGLPAPARPSSVAPEMALSSSSTLHPHLSAFHPSPLGLHPPISASQVNQNTALGPVPPHPTGVNPDNTLPASQHSAPNKPSLSHPASQPPHPSISGLGGPDTIAAPGAPAAVRDSALTPAAPNTGAAPGVPLSGGAPPLQAAPELPKAAPVTARSSLGIPSFAAQLLSQDKPTTPQQTPGAAQPPPVGTTPGASQPPPLGTPGAAQPPPLGTTPGATPASNDQNQNNKRPRPKPRIRAKKSNKLVESPPPEDSSSTNPSTPQPPPPQITASPLNVNDGPHPFEPPLQQGLVDAESSGARRSARPIAKNTWLEKQNLIGTNAIFHAQNPTSTADTSDEIPHWFLAAIDYFKTGDLGSEWMLVLERWAQLEQSLGFGKVGKTPLSVQHRPDEWQKWTAKAKNGVRPYDKTPVIDEPAEFGLSLLKWWSSLQPAFRISPDTGALLPIYCDDTIEGDAWVTTRKSGPNGFVSFITLLDWWGRGAATAGPFKDDSRAEWLRVVMDVSLCLGEMLKPVAKRSVETELESSNKRQRVK